MRAIRAEMAATVWKMKVHVGSHVVEGEELAILESMKMEIPVFAPLAGMVTTVHVAEGGLVGPGDLLVDINPA